MADDAAGAVRRTPRPADPELFPAMRAELEEWRAEAARGLGNGWPLLRVRHALGTPDGRAVSVHAAEVVAERDGLQARIGAALALMDYWDAHGGSIPQGRRLRAALRGDQPTSPPPPARGAIGEWLFQGYDQLGQPTWEWWTGAPEPTGEADRG